MISTERKYCVAYMRRGRGRGCREGQQSAGYKTDHIKSSPQGTEKCVPTSCSCVKGQRGTEMDIKINEPTSQGMRPGSSGGCLNSAWSRIFSVFQASWCWAEGRLTRLALGAESWVDETSEIRSFYPGSGGCGGAAGWFLVGGWFALRLTLLNCFTGWRCSD